LLKRQPRGFGPTSQGTSVGPSRQRGSAVLQRCGAKRVTVFVSCRHVSWSQGQEVEGGGAGGSAFPSGEAPAGQPPRDGRTSLRTLSRRKVWPSWSGRAVRRRAWADGAVARRFWVCPSGHAGSWWRRRPGLLFRQWSGSECRDFQGFGPGCRRSQRGESLKSRAKPKGASGRDVVATRRGGNGLLAGSLP
jgi:hypothetical protein